MASTFNYLNVVTGHINFFQYPRKDSSTNLFDPNSIEPFPEKDTFNKFGSQ